MGGVALHDVTVRLGERAVVDGVSLAVREGEWAALIGPNGAGKTTTLRAIAGLVAHRGTVELGGVDARSLGRRARARTVALVPQVPTTPADMTVADYVLLGRTPHMTYLATEARGDRDAARRALERLDLLGLADRRLGSLSGGERQRAVLARALAQEPRVILLDEPTSALDLGRQQHALELVDLLRRQDGLTVVAAMHDLTSVALYADTVHLLGEGRLAASGHPRDVLREEALHAHFGAAVRVFEHDGELVVTPVRREAVLP